MCTQDAQDQKTQFGFIGDYIDRGPDSRGVVEYLMTLQQTQPDCVTCLTGNHEHMLLSAIDRVAHEERWLQNGGAETLRSYGAPNLSGIPDAHITWFRGLPNFDDDGLRFVVHAESDPAKLSINKRDTIYSGSESRFFRRLPTMAA
jgi:serine/threonine protein phosphatase 1